MLTLSPSLMGNMEVEHLLNALACEPEIMRTPVELELVRRCEMLADKLHEASGIIEVTEEFEVDADDLRVLFESHPASIRGCALLLAMLNDAEIERPDQLAKLLAARGAK